MDYLKKEIENGAKATMIRVLPPSYKKGHHKRREIIKKGHLGIACNFKEKH
ncbi:MAG: hypothetical protein QXF09_02985 [Nitrososphaerota archaeon]